MLIEIKTWIKGKKYYHNNREKSIDLKKTRHDIQKIEKNEVENKIQNITQIMETLQKTISVP